MKVLQIGRYPRLEMREVPTPEPGSGEVLLRVGGVTTCPQWDLHLRHAEPMFVGHRFEYPYTPGQPGHEATGVVAAVGAGVSTVAVGDRVSAWRDQGHHVWGCYAEYAVLAAENLIRVPPGLPLAATAPIELAMCVGATFLVLKEMGGLRGLAVGINGLGPAGLVAAQMARAEGASSVVGFDPTARRREGVAARLLDAAYDPTSDLGNQFPARPAGPALDVIIDCVGAKRSVEWAMDRARSKVALFGVQREDYVYAPRHYGGLSLVGYPGHSRAAAEYAVGLVECGALDLSALVTHTLPLAEYQQGVDLLERQEAVKVLFIP